VAKCNELAADDLNFSANVCAGGQLLVAGFGPFSSPKSSPASGKYWQELPLSTSAQNGSGLAADGWSLSNLQLYNY